MEASTLPSAAVASERVAVPSRRLRRRRNPVLERMAPPFEHHLEAAVGDVRSVLDVGCGANSPLGRFERRYERAVGVDLFPRAIEEAHAKGIHDSYVVLDVLRIAERFAPGAFDACVAFDVLEHLAPGDGARLLERMERVAARRVVVFTPNGFLEQEPTDGNPYQVHRSGWTAEDLRERGYAVTGVNGLRILRGHKASIRLRPRRVWGAVSDLSQPLVARRPELAFHLLAVKDLTLPPAVYG